MNFLDTIKVYEKVLSQEDKYIRNFECVVGFGKELPEVLNDCFVDCVNALLEDISFYIMSVNYESIEYSKNPTMILNGKYYLTSWDYIDHMILLAKAFSSHMQFNFEFEADHDFSNLAFSVPYMIYHRKWININAYIDIDRFPQLVSQIMKSIKQKQLNS